MKYKYIVFGNNFPYYQIAYSSLNNIDNIKYFKDILPIKGGKLVSFLCKIWFSKKINSIINLPFKSILSQYYLPNGLNKQEKYCFIFMNQETVFRILPYLKKNFLNSKFVFYKQDLFAKSGIKNINAFINQFDLTLSYDPIEAKKYNIIYHPTPFTYIQLPSDSRYSSDVYYLGTAKERLSTILKAFDILKEKGLKCKFFIYGEVPIEIKQKYQDICFPEEYISYMENLNYVRNTKCILEVMQSGAIGFTPRVWEAISYDKTLITNNTYLKESPFYNSNYMLFSLDDIQNVKKDFFTQTVSYTNNVKNTLNPINLINFLDNNL